ncbi:MAG: hypothetical protein ACLRR6_12725 [Oscillospiraceae bacterium]
MKKRLLSGLTLLALLLQCLLLPAFAEPTDAPADPTEPSASETVADATEPDARAGCDRRRRADGGDRGSC